MHWPGSISKARHLFRCCKWSYREGRSIPSAIYLQRIVYILALLLLTR